MYRHESTYCPTCGSTLHAAWDEATSLTVLRCRYARCPRSRDTEPQRALSAFDWVILPPAEQDALRTLLLRCEREAQVYGAGG